VVQEVQQVYTNGSGNGGTIGAVIGAVAGGVLGNQVGKGDGRKAATVAGAVAGGVVGNQVGKRNSGNDVAWRIVVRLDNGQYATVTQRDNPGVRNGDYVEVRGDHVYAM
jgi:outer membrane lipoprotein SlyB